MSIRSFFILFLFSSNAFSKQRPNTYGLLTNHRGEPLVTYNFPLIIHVSLAGNEPSIPWSVTVADMRIIMESLFNAGRWINGYLMSEIIKIKLHSGDYKRDSFFDGKAHFIYETQGLINATTGHKLAGKCESIARKDIAPFNWFGKGNELMDHRIIVSADYLSMPKFFEAVLRHEILHALGFAHVAKGIMVSNLTPSMVLSGVADYIDLDQLINW